MKRAWILVLVGLGALMWGVLRQAEADQLDVLEDQMLAAGRGLHWSGDESATRKLLVDAQNTTGCRVRWLSSKGRVVLDSYGRDEGKDLSLRPEVAAALQGRYEPSWRDSDERPASQALFAAVPLAAGGAVYLTHDTQELEEHTQRLHAWLSDGLALVALAFLGWELAGRRRALRRLRQAIDRPEPETIEVGGDNESAAIAQGFNRVVRSLREKVGQLEDERSKTRHFLEDVAHELKTPLTGLSGSVEVLLGSASQADATLLRQVARETERLQQLVAQLLDLQKLDRYELRGEVFDLTSLVDTVLESFELRAQREGLKLDLEAKEEGVRAWGDPTRIRSVIENLLDNALRCSPPGGEVTVRVEPDRLVVCDQGPGVSSEDREHIFERFRNGRAPAGSAGLGLAIAREIVLKHGQRIGILPSQRGACFYFTFSPAAGEPARASPE